MLPGGGGGGSEAIDDEGHFSFETGVGVSAWDELGSMSDGCMFCLVSCLSGSVGSGAVG